MRIGAVVQARMSSERFPGKTLFEVGGKPMLAYVLERLAHCGGLDSVVVATSTDRSDDPVAEYCADSAVAVTRGPLGDVAGRFAVAVAEHSLDVFVRVNGDSPLLDQKLIERGLELFRRGDDEPEGLTGRSEHGPSVAGSGRGPDLVTNVFPRTFPPGESVEVVSAAAFDRARQQMAEPEDLEHVTRYFYRHADDFAIVNFAPDRAYEDLRLAVDTSQDMDLFVAIVGYMDRPHWEYGVDEVAALARVVALGGPDAHAPDVHAPTGQATDGNAAGTGQAPRTKVGGTG